MQIIRERPCNRRAYGITAPLFVSVDGAELVRAVEWSRLGVVLHAEDLNVAGSVSLSLMLDFQGFDIVVPVEARPTTDPEAAVPEGCVRLDFVDLDQRGSELLEHFVEGIVRGRFSTATDTLLSIDTPVDPISTTPDAKSSKNPASRRRLWPAAMTGFYLFAGLVVFGYAGLVMWSSFVKLEVQTAVVTRPVDVVAMPVDGMLRQVLARSGETVARGALIARLRDPALEREIDGAQIALSEADTTLTRLEERLALETVRLADYRLINRTERDAAAAEVEAHDAEVATLAAAFDRAQRLKAAGHTTVAAVEDAEAAHALAVARLRAARLMLERSEALHDASATRHHNGREFVADLDMLRLDVTAARDDRDAAAARLGALLDVRDRLEIRAPWRGRVVDVMREDGARLLRGEPIVALERDVAPMIEAWLNQEEVLEIGLGDRATVFLPALDRELRARVIRIDRTSGFVDEQRSQYTWRGPDDRSARVEMAIDGEAAHDLASGLPAVTLFDRRDPSALHAGVRRQLGTKPARPVGDDV